MKKGVLFIAAITALLAACQKDEHLSMRETGIVKGSWKVKTRDTFNTVSPDTIGYDTLSSLERITRYRFFRDGTMARISLFTLDTSKVQDSAITGRWLLEDADTRLTLTDSNLLGTYNFRTYNDSLMVLVLTSSTGDTDSSVVTTVLRRQ